MSLRPSMLMVTATAALATFLAVTYATRPDYCSQPASDGAVFLELLSGSLSLLCVFGAIVMYGEREDWPLVGSVVTGLFATALWAVGALYVGFAVSGLSACLG